MPRLIIGSVRVQIGCDDERVAELIERRYARMLDPNASRKPDVTAYIMSRGQSTGVIVGDEFVRPFDDETLKHGRPSVAAIEGRAMLAINARLFRCRPEIVAFHAAAVAVGDHAAVVVGPTTSGKSTTALSLLVQDHANKPLSDEFALVNTATGFVESFPRLFSIRAGTRKLLGLNALSLDWDAVDPEGIITTGWAEHARRACYFFLVGRERVASARPLRLSEAIFFAIGSCVASTLDSDHFRVVDHVIKGLSGARLYALTAGSPEDTADLIARTTHTADAAVA